MARTLRSGRLHRSHRPLIVGWTCLTIWASAACGGGPSPVVFTSDRDGNLELYAATLDDGQETNLTNTPGDEYSPRVSPDGRLVAFLSGSGETVALEVMKIDGTERRVLTAGAGVRSHHRWSPDSTRIAYVEKKEAESRVFVVTVDEPIPTQLTSVPADVVGGWSPDGVSVIFAVSQGPAQGVYTRNPDGVNEIRLTETPDVSPIWSPGSKRVAMVSHRDGNPEIYMMKEDGSEQIRLTENEANEYSVSWSPNGKRLLFVSDRDGNPEIYTTDAEGGDQKRLSQNEVADVQPVWSSDGGRIAFVSYVDGDAEIIVMDADGSNQTRLTNNTLQDTEPSW